MMLSGHAFEGNKVLNTQHHIIYRFSFDIYIHFAFIFFIETIQNMMLSGQAFLGDYALKTQHHILHIFSFDLFINFALIFLS